MITRSHRFHGYNSLRHVYQKGKTVKSAMLSVKYVRNERRDTFRAAVVVSRKVSKLAVVRNKIRRRLYEEVRSLTITEPYDIVITVFDDAVNAPNGEALRAALRKLLIDSGVATLEGTGTKQHAIIDGKE